MFNFNSCETQLPEKIIKRATVSVLNSAGLGLHLMQQRAS